MSSTITLNDQKRLKEQFSKLGFCLSEYSFANCYLFREIHKYRIEENFLKGRSREGYDFYMPLSYPFDTSLHSSFYPIPETWLSLFPEDQFIRTAAESDKDYLFTIEKMTQYPGRSLAGQRNFVRQFLNQYEPGSVPCQNNFKKEPCREILKAWREAHKEEGDFNSCMEAIDQLEELGLIGFLVCSQDEPVGFIIAEQLLEEMVVIHFAKGKPNIKGLYPYMYQAFCKTLPYEVKWINLEQDLGVPGLVKAKSAYHPDKMLPKYHVTRKH